MAIQETLAAIGTAADVRKRAARLREQVDAHYKEQMREINEREDADLKTLEQVANLRKGHEENGCRLGLHSWIGEQGKLPPDYKCTDCGEPYGDPS